MILVIGILLFSGINLASAQAIEQLCRAATEGGQTFAAAGLSKEVCCPLLPEAPECKALVKKLDPDRTYCWKCVDDKIEFYSGSPGAGCQYGENELKKDAEVKKIIESFTNEKDLAEKLENEAWIACKVPQCLRCFDGKNYVKYVLGEEEKCGDLAAHHISLRYTLENENCRELIKLQRDWDNFLLILEECKKQAEAERGYRKISVYVNEYVCKDYGVILYELFPPTKEKIYAFTTTDIDNPILGKVKVFHNLKDIQKNMLTEQIEFIADSYLDVDGEIASISDQHLSSKVIEGKMTEEEIRKTNLALAKDMAEKEQLALSKEGLNLVPATGTVRDARHSPMWDFLSARIARFWFKNAIWYDQENDVVVQREGKWYKQADEYGNRLEVRITEGRWGRVCEGVYERIGEKKEMIRKEGMWRVKKSGELFLE